MSGSFHNVAHAESLVEAAARYRLACDARREYLKAHLAHVAETDRLEARNRETARDLAETGQKLTAVARGGDPLPVTP